MMKGMVFAERYRLEEFIGQGGMSLVYCAVDIRTGHRVAVKILKSEYNSDKEFLERFQREAQAASLMNHHNIVNLLDVGVEGEYRYLVLEYVNGNTLKDIIVERGGLDPNLSIQIGVRILSALQHAHDNGIIHRDIKPQNILIHSDGHVKVADFGIARMTNAFTISKGDTVVGSVHYASPEQTTGSVVKTTSDIYSLGVVMYEMLTGHVPFVGDTPVAVAMQHINELPPPISIYTEDAALASVIMRALEKNPENRFQTAREMADALLKAKEGKYDAPINHVNEIPQLRTEDTQSPVTTQQEQSKNVQGLRKKHFKRKHSAWSVGIIVGFLVVLAAGIIFIYVTISGNVVAPDLVGMTLEEGIKIAEREELLLNANHIKNQTVPAGVILLQAPEPDLTMRKGDSLLVTVSAGPEKIITPDLTNSNYEQAKLTLNDMGIGITVVKVASIEREGTVIAQSPKAGSILAEGKEVELTISGGSVTVPDLLGLKADDLSETVNGIELVDLEISYIESEDPSKVGTITTQTPIAGTLVVKGATIYITIGKVPNPYNAEISLSIPQKEVEQSLLVTLMQEGKEVEQFNTIISAGQKGSMNIPLSSTQMGAQRCLVYVDDELLLSENIIFE